MMTQFRNDGFGLRVQKTDAQGQSTFYLLDGLHVLAEKDANAATKVRYIPGVGQIRDGQTHYYLHDALGSVVALTDEDGNMTDRYQCDAWGNVISKDGATPNPYLWGGAWGYYADVDTGLYLLGKRWLSSLTGRFLTTDPIGLGSGDMNRYRAMRNNAANVVDSLGLQPSFVGPSATTLSPADLALERMLRESYWAPAPTRMPAERTFSNCSASFNPTGRPETPQGNAATAYLLMGAIYGPALVALGFLTIPENAIAGAYAAAVTGGAKLWAAIMAFAGTSGVQKAIEAANYAAQGASPTPPPTFGAIGSNLPWYWQQGAYFGGYQLMPIIQTGQPAVPEVYTAPREETGGI